MQSSYFSSEKVRVDFAPIAPLANTRRLWATVVSYLYGLDGEDEVVVNGSALITAINEHPGGQDGSSFLRNYRPNNKSPRIS
jgi:hypothetical protein